MWPPQLPHPVERGSSQTTLYFSYFQDIAGPFLLQGCPSYFSLSLQYSSPTKFLLIFKYLHNCHTFFKIPSCYYTLQQHPVVFFPKNVVKVASKELSNHYVCIAPSVNDLLHDNRDDLPCFMLYCQHFSWSMLQVLNTCGMKELVKL